VANLISKSVTSLAAFALGAVMTVTAAEAQQGTRTVTGERYATTIWVDPNGCDHWIIDDGIEGYLSQRLDPYGKPVCSGIAPPNTAIAPFKAAQTINDPL
jgi:hypothetical protein